MADTTIQVIKTVRPDSLQRRLERLLKKLDDCRGMPILKIDPTMDNMPIYKSPVPLAPMPIYSPCEKYPRRFRRLPRWLPQLPRPKPPCRHGP